MGEVKQSTCDTCPGYKPKVVKDNPCSNCDSTSMETCLLVRHCKHWANKGGENSEIR